MTTARELADLLERTVAAEVVHLRAVPDGPGTRRPNRPSGKGWSMREELGHLIDSAVNNHDRIARAALSPSFEGPGYDQEGATTRQVEEDHFGGYARGLYNSLMRDVGIPPKVWGQSRACARMVRKSHMHSLGIRASRI